MGLSISHDTWYGAYSAFNRFRQAIAWAMDGSYPPHYRRNGDGSLNVRSDGSAILALDMDPEQFYVGDDFAKETHPGLWEFMQHSDCDGDIDPDICAKLADEMESLLPKLDMLNEAGGHMPDGPAAAARRFINGCRLAAMAGEPLEFG